MSPFLHGNHVSDAVRAFDQYLRLPHALMVEAATPCWGATPTTQVCVSLVKMKSVHLQRAH